MMNPLSQLYQFGVQVDRAMTRQRELKRPVLSVGNIAMGGRAKTPLTIRIAQEMKKRGTTPVVLTRGYGRKRSQDIWLDPSTPNFEFSTEETGDEPIEIFLKAGCFVLVGANRYENGRRFLKRFTRLPNVMFLLDDGFQHWSLKRDVDICVIESFDRSASVFPVGNLRECVQGLERADIVLELGKDILKKSKFLKAPQKMEHALALTTRAVNSEYRKFLTQNLDNCQLVELKDHAGSDAMLTVIRERKPSELILGFKEAVKLLKWSELKRLSAEGRLDISFEGRPLEIYVVDCEIEIAEEEDFWIKVFECLY